MNYVKLFQVVTELNFDFLNFVHFKYTLDWKETIEISEKI